MFPLGSVLLPTSLIPLRLFEPRYLAMIEDVMADDREFGVVLIERGHEVGGGDIRSTTGCIAQVLDTSREPSGMWHVVAAGTRRFTVDAWLPDDPYPRAEITFITEAPAVDADATGYDDVRRRLVTVNALMGETGRSSVEIPELSDDPALGSFQVAALGPFGSFDRQRLLCSLEPAERLTTLTELLGDLEADLRAELSLGS